MNPQPFIKIRVGYKNVFLCHPNGQAEKTRQPINRYYENPNYKRPN